MGVSYRNQEGYSDPVPFRAISNIDTVQRRYMPMVYICSAYRGDVEENVRKARKYCRYAVDKGVIPIAPHLLLTQFMEEETERELAMFMDIAILSKCKELWVFGEPTVGMQNEIAYAERKQIAVRYFNENMKEEE